MKAILNILVMTGLCLVSGLGFAAPESPTAMRVLGMVLAQVDEPVRERYSLGAADRLVIIDVGSSHQQLGLPMLDPGTVITFITGPINGESRSPANPHAFAQAVLDLCQPTADSQDRRICQLIVRRPAKKGPLSTFAFLRLSLGPAEIAAFESAVSPLPVEQKAIAKAPDQTSAIAGRLGRRSL